MLSEHNQGRKLNGRLEIQVSTQICDTYMKEKKDGIGNLRGKN